MTIVNNLVNWFLQPEFLRNNKISALCIYDKGKLILNIQSDDRNISRVIDKFKAQIRVYRWKQTVDNYYDGGCLTLVINK